MGLLKHSDKVEAEAVFRERFDEVVANSNSWIAMVGRVKPDGCVEVFRTTSNFPQERFLDAAAELRKSMIEELHGSLLPDAPLPRAAQRSPFAPPPPALPTVKSDDVRYSDDLNELNELRAEDTPGTEDETPGDHE